MNKIFYSTQATNDLKKLDNVILEQVMKKIKQLEQNSEIGKPLRNIYKNKRSLHIEKFRVIYSTQANEVIIAKIKHRKEAYE